MGSLAGTPRRRQRLAALDELERRREMSRRIEELFLERLGQVVLKGIPTETSVSASVLLPRTQPLAFRRDSRDRTEP